MTSINTTMGAREWAMLIALSILWGGSFFFVGIAVADLPPLTIVALRVGLAAPILWGVVLMMGLQPPTDLRAYTAFFVMGLLNNAIPFSLLVWGQTQIASGLASILTATAPIFTVIVAGLLLSDERATPLKITGIAIGFVGVVIIIGPSTFGDMGENVLAQIAILGTALAYAIAGVFGRRFKAMGIDPIITAAGQVTASFLIMVPLAFFVEQPLELAMPPATTVAAIIGLALLSTAVAYILYFRILASVGATNLLLVTLLVPVSAILLGSFGLGETLDSNHFLGMALIAVGLSTIDGRLWRKNYSINQ